MQTAVLQPLCNRCEGFFVPTKGRRLSRIRVPGSVYRRSNGRWTAITPEVFDHHSGTSRRVSLGTFDSRSQAVDALTAFHHGREVSMSNATHVLRMRLSDYLTDWLGLVKAQVDAGHLARRTFSGHEAAIRLHIIPALGSMRIEDLDGLTIHRWLIGLKSQKGLADRTILRLFRSLHRALADSSLPQNPAALPRHLRPTVRDAGSVYRPKSDEISTFLAHTSSWSASFSVDWWFDSPRLGSV
jgi:hypothetical protein